MEGAPTMETLITAVGQIVEGSLGWVGKAGETVIANPILLLPVGIGLAVGLIKMIK
jgi:hypothetical protein